MNIRGVEQGTDPLLVALTEVLVGKLGAEETRFTLDEWSGVVYADRTASALMLSVREGIPVLDIANEIEQRTVKT